MAARPTITHPHAAAGLDIRHCQQTAIEFFKEIASGSFALKRGTRSNATAESCGSAWGSKVRIQACGMDLESGRRRRQA